MQDKYDRLANRGRESPHGDGRIAIVDAMIDSAGFERVDWNDQTYAAARALFAALASGAGWFPFSAPGLSVGPSVRPDLLRVDLVDSDDRPCAFLATQADLFHWISRIERGCAVVAK